MTAESIFWTTQPGLSPEADDQRKINILKHMIRGNNNYYCLFDTTNLNIVKFIDDYLLARGSSSLSSLNKLLELLDFITLRQLIKHLNKTELRVDDYHHYLAKHASIEHVHLTFRIIKHTPRGRQRYENAILMVHNLALDIAEQSRLSLEDVLCASFDYLSITYGKSYSRVCLDLYLNAKDPIVSSEARETLQQALTNRTIDRSIKYSKNNTQQLLVKIFGVKSDEPHVGKLLEGLNFTQGPTLSTYDAIPTETIVDITPQDREELTVILDLLPQILQTLFNQQNDLRTIYATTAFIFFALTGGDQKITLPILISLTDIILQTQPTDKFLCYKTVTQLLRLFSTNQNIEGAVLQLAYQYKNQTAIKALMDYCDDIKHCRFIELTIYHSSQIAGDCLSTVIQLTRQILQEQNDLNHLLSTITPTSAGDAAFTQWRSQDFESNTNQIKQLLIGLVSHLNTAELSRSEKKIFIDIYCSLLNIPASHDRSFLFLFYAIKLNTNIAKMFFELELYFDLSGSDLFNKIFQILETEAGNPNTIKPAIELFTLLIPKLLPGSPTSTKLTYSALFSFIKIFSQTNSNHKAFDKLLELLTDKQLADCLQCIANKISNGETINDHGKLFLVTFSKRITRTLNSDLSYTENAPYATLLFKVINTYWMINRNNKQLIYNIHFTLENWSLTTDSLCKLSALLLHHSIDQYAALNLLDYSTERQEQKDFYINTIKTTFKKLTEMDSMGPIMKSEYLKPCYEHYLNLPGCKLLTADMQRDLSALLSGNPAPPHPTGLLLSHSVTSRPHESLMQEGKSQAYSAVRRDFY